jgi:hypothetical protein
LLIELVLVLNHRIGFWSDMIKRGSNVQKGRDFTLVYLELYEKTEKYLMRKNYNSTRENWQILE